MAESDEIQRQWKEARRAALTTFPFERVRIAGHRALGEWHQLAQEGRTAVIVGDDERFENLAQPVWNRDRSVAEILDAVTPLSHPQSLIDHRREAWASAEEHLKSLGIRPLPRKIEDVALTPAAALPGGQFILDALRNFEPTPLPAYHGREELASLSVLHDLRTGGLIENANLVVIPTDDWTTVPAHLKWGGWNDCPAPEFHVAALRSWRDRFGVKLVALGSDRMDLKVARPPETAEAALNLALEQYAYCADIVDQGSGNIESLAAELLNGGWWHFWWD